MGAIRRLCYYLTDNLDEYKDLIALTDEPETRKESDPSELAGGGINEALRNKLGKLPFKKWAPSDIEPDITNDETGFLYYITRENSITLVNYNTGYSSAFTFIKTLTISDAYIPIEKDLAISLRVSLNGMLRHYLKIKVIRHLENKNALQKINAVYQKISLADYVRSKTSDFFKFSMNMFKNDPDTTGKGEEFTEYKKMLQQLTDDYVRNNSAGNDFFNSLARLLRPDVALFTDTITEGIMKIENVLRQAAFNGNSELKEAFDSYTVSALAGQSFGQMLKDYNNLKSGNRKNFGDFLNQAGVLDNIIQVLGYTTQKIIKEFALPHYKKTGKESQLAAKKEEAAVRRMDNLVKDEIANYYLKDAELIVKYAGEIKDYAEGEKEEEDLKLNKYVAEEAEKAKILPPAKLKGGAKYDYAADYLKRSNYIAALLEAFKQKKDILNDDNSDFNATIKTALDAANKDANISEIMKEDGKFELIELDMIKGILISKNKEKTAIIEQAFGDTERKKDYKKFLDTTVHANIIDNNIEIKKVIKDLEDTNTKFKSSSQSGGGVLTLKNETDVTDFNTALSLQMDTTNVKPAEPLPVKDAVEDALKDLKIIDKASETLEAEITRQRDELAKLKTTLNDALDAAKAGETKKELEDQKAEIEKKLAALSSPATDTKVADLQKQLATKETEITAAQAELAAAQVAAAAPPKVAPVAPPAAPGTQTAEEKAVADAEAKVNNLSKEMEKLKTDIEAATPAPASTGMDTKESLTAAKTKLEADIAAAAGAAGAAAAADPTTAQATYDAGANPIKELITKYQAKLKELEDIRNKVIADQSENVQAALNNNIKFKAAELDSKANAFKAAVEKAFSSVAPTLLLSAEAKAAQEKKDKEAQKFKDAAAAKAAAAAKSSAADKAAAAASGTSTETDARIDELENKLQAIVNHQGDIDPAEASVRAYMTNDNAMARELKISVKIPNTTLFNTFDEQGVPFEAGLKAIANTANEADDKVDMKNWLDKISKDKTLEEDITERIKGIPLPPTLKPEIQQKIDEIKKEMMDLAKDAASIKEKDERDPNSTPAANSNLAKLWAKYQEYKQYITDIGKAGPNSPTKAPGEPIKASGAPDAPAPTMADIKPLLTTWAGTDAAKLAAAKPLTDAADEAAFKTALTAFQKDAAYAGLDQPTKDKITALLAVKVGGGSRKTHKRRHKHSRKRHSRRKSRHRHKR